MEKRDTARGKLGDRKGLGASTDARSASNAASRRSARLASVSIHGDAKSQQCVAACATAASILDRIPGMIIAPPVVHSAAMARSADVCKRKASKAALPAVGPLMSSKTAAVVKSSNPSAVALPQVPPFLRFFDPDLFLSDFSASAHLPVPHGLES